MAAIIAPAMLIMVGLVVDGGGQLGAVRQAEAVAAQAARAGADAGAASQVAGGSVGTTAARTAAEAHLRAAGVSGDVVVQQNQVVVRTTVTHQTVFLGLIGVWTLPGSGEAAARIVPSQPG
ncbi:pilus assembly protein TadG-related protein [Propionibacteriaceae bacterium Y2011]